MSETLGKFGIGISLHKSSNTDVKAEFQSANQGVPDEIVIMNLRAFLQNLERSFLDKFEATHK